MMQEYWITEYGAVADGVTNCAAAIQAAVDAAAQAGGGRVMVPAGRFLSGSVMLRSHVELHLCSGAVLQSSLRPEDIRPFRHAGRRRRDGRLERRLFSGGLRRAGHHDLGQRRH